MSKIIDERTSEGGMKLDWYALYEKIDSGQYAGVLKQVECMSDPVVLRFVIRLLCEKLEQEKE